MSEQKTAMLKIHDLTREPEDLMPDQSDAARGGATLLGLANTQPSYVSPGPCAPVTVQPGPCAPAEVAPGPCRL